MWIFDKIFRLGVFSFKHRIGNRILDFKNGVSNMFFLEDLLTCFF